MCVYVYTLIHVLGTRRLGNSVENKDYLQTADRDGALEIGKQVWFGSNSESELATKREEVKEEERMSIQFKN